MSRIGLVFLLTAAITPGAEPPAADASPPPAEGRSAARIERLDAKLDALIPKDAVVERVAEGIEWAEGPLWDAREGALLFSDVPRNAVFRWKSGADVTQLLRDSGYTGKAPFSGRGHGRVIRMRFAARRKPESYPHRPARVS